MTSMGIIPRIKRKMAEETKEVRNASWISKPEGLQRGEIRNLKGAAGLGTNKAIKLG